MAINYPTSLDAFTNPTKWDQLNTPGLEHDVQHSNHNDAIEALEAKVGVDNSAVTTSLDYRVRQLEGSVGAPITPATGTGSPEGVVTGAPGRIYLDTSIDPPSLWIKFTGTGNTGWRQLIA